MTTNLGEDYPISWHAGTEEDTGIAVSLNLGARWELGGQRDAQAISFPKKSAGVVVQEDGWAPRPVWKRGNLLPPPSFEPRTIQLVTSRYTDNAVPVPNIN
jgi:hypothetical protein